MPITLACLLYAGYGCADGESVTVSGKTYEWIESSRRYVGETVQALTGSVDTYLSRDTSDVPNDSYLRLRIGYIFEEDGHTYFNNDIKFKVELPKTENRWSLIFETNPQEFESLEVQQQDSKSRPNALENTDGSIGAVKFIFNEWRYWKADFDVGVKTPLPLDPFVRFNIRRRYQLTENWGLRLKNSAYYFHQDGFGEHSTAVFERPLSPNWTFFNAIDLRWQDVDEILEYSDVVTFQHLPTDRDIFWYRAGAFYQEHPRPYLQSYFIDMVYRRRLHDHWLFGEVIPSVTWAEDGHFNDLAALTFRVEVIFD